MAEAHRHVYGPITQATPASASTAVGAILSLPGIEQFDRLEVIAVCTAGAGGTLDVYLQRRIITNVWADWIHFTQMAAGVTTRFSHSQTMSAATGTPTTVGVGTDATPSVVLAANAIAIGSPAGGLRPVYVAGVGASAAGSVTFYITGTRIAT